MSVESERISLQQYAWDELHDDNVLSTILFEESDFNPDVIEEFILMSILNGDSGQISMGSSGSRLFRHEGIAQFDIYTMPDTGTSKQKVMAEKIRKMFRDKQMTLSDGDVISFREASTRPGGRERGKVRYIVSVPYYRDEVA